MIHKTISLLVLFYGCSWNATGQLLHDQKGVVFTREDSLRGMLTPLRTSYDVRYYHLDVRVDPETRSIKGANTIRFTVIEPLDVMQVDLFENMGIEKVMLDDGMPLSYTREYNAVFIRFPTKLGKGKDRAITISYSGKPLVAKRPPWEGGFVWTKDSSGNPWVAVACQGIGASLWWPNKDHQADEPDSMLISITVPKGFEEVSNGRLRGKTPLPDGWTRFDWLVSYPINNYNVTVNVGMFSHFQDLYVNKDTLTLDYFVMPQNLARAKVQFEQVKPMLACFEKYFGKFPFRNDGYKLVESPHLGMEHQGAIAYGNRYINGYKGTASSQVGLQFDFIIVHESSHEWWGNSVTSKDIADMWIHESFGAYAEALYVECRFGYEEALKYITGKKWNVMNTSPIIGVYGVNHEGSKDMYDKGQLVFNTLRHVIGNDSVWFSTLRGLAETFRYQTISAEDLISYVNRCSGMDLTYFFDQYLRFPKIPQLEISVTKTGNDVRAKYKWNADVDNFRMPIKVMTSKDRYDFIYPTVSWQTLTLEDINPEEFRVAEDQFYVDVKLTRRYVDPNAPDMHHQ